MWALCKHHVFEGLGPFSADSGSRVQHTSRGLDERSLDFMSVCGKLRARMSLLCASITIAACRLGRPLTFTPAASATARAMYASVARSRPPAAPAGGAHSSSSLPARGRFFSLTAFGGAARADAAATVDAAATAHWRCRRRASVRARERSGRASGCGRAPKLAPRLFPRSIIKERGDFDSYFCEHHR